MALLPSPGVFTDFLLSAYNKVLDGVPVIGSAIDLASKYRQPDHGVHARVNALIRAQSTIAAQNGFLLGLPGTIFAPVSIPVDIAQSMYLQLRMVAAIAHLYGHDVKSNQVRTIALACLTGSKATDIMRNAGVKIGQKMATKMIESISAKTIKSINQAVGMRLVTKFGEKGLINLGKVVPIMGGVVGGTFNGLGTFAVGKAAKALLQTS